MAIKTVNLGGFGGEGFVFTPQPGVRYKVRNDTYTFLTVKAIGYSGEVGIQTSDDYKYSSSGDFAVTRKNIGWVEFSGNLWKVAITPCGSYTAAPPLVPLVIPASSNTYGARDWLRGTLTQHGLNYATVAEIPFGIDSSRVTDMTSMFQGCRALTKVPALDASNVRNMSSMFEDCAALKEAPQLNTSRVEFAASMFAGCRALTRVPDMRAENLVGAASMFQGCTALTDGNVRLIGKNPDVITIGMIANSGLTREPFYDTSGKII